MTPPVPALFQAQLGPAEVRQLVNRRRIECEAHLRDDGLLDIDAWLMDTRGHDMPMMNGALPAGQALHEMGLRLTIEMSRRIVAARALTLHGPSPECVDIAPAYAQLVGLVIGPGLRGQVRQLLGGRAGCTHLSELLGPMATTAMQALWWLRAQAQARTDPVAARREVPGPVDSCHAWREDGVMVQFHRRLIASD